MMGVILPRHSAARLSQEVIPYRGDEVDVYGSRELFASNKFGGGNKDMKNNK